MNASTKHFEILRFLRVLASASNAVPVIYTQGGCYRLYELLQRVWPDALPYYDMDHVITGIDGRFYDIRGEAEHTDKYLPMTNLEMVQAENSACVITIRDPIRDVTATGWTTADEALEILAIDTTYP